MKVIRSQGQGYVIQYALGGLWISEREARDLVLDLQRLLITEVVHSPVDGVESVSEGEAT